jgi:cell division protein FtsQ
MAAMKPPAPRVARRAPKRTAPAWLRRGVKAALWLGVAGLLAVSWRSGRLADLVQQARDEGVRVSFLLGFRIQQVEVVGRLHTDRQELLAKAGLRKGGAMLDFDPQDVRQRIEALPWVMSAAVERRLPDTVAITLVERTPVAIWQHNEKVTLIDAGGANLGSATNEPGFEGLPRIIGGDAPAHAPELFGLLAKHPEIARRVQFSSWIGSRRWDLRLDNGVDVLLPEDGVEAALDALADAEASSRLFERDVAAIDLRLPGKMVVRMSHDLPAAAPRAKPQQGI